MSTDPRSDFNALEPQIWSERASDRRALLAQDAVNRLGRRGAAVELGISVGRVDVATARARRLTDEEKAAALALDKLSLTDTA